VVARSFGSPSVTAECAAPLLAVGGQLLVSEPPSPSADRWPAAGLALVGLRLDETVSGLASCTQVEPCPERFPRRRLRPPLFELFHVEQQAARASAAVSRETSRRFRPKT